MGASRIVSDVAVGGSHPAVTRCYHRPAVGTEWRHSKLSTRKYCFSENTFVTMSTGALEPTCVPLEGCIVVKNLTVKISSEEAKPLGKLFIVGVYETSGPKELFKPEGKLKEVDASSQGCISELIAREEFSGRDGKFIASHVNTGGYVAIVGLGKKENFVANTSAKAGKIIATLVNTYQPQELSIDLPSAMTPTSLEVLLSGLFVDLAPDNRFKSQDNKKKLAPLKTMTVFVKDSVEKHEVAAGKAKTLAEGVKYTMELVGGPPNFVTTTNLAMSAVDMAKDVGLEAKVLESADAEKLGMGCFLGVGKGALHPPKFIHLTYKPKGEVKKKIALIGKAVTFDSGGYNLKVGGMIELMKFDMAGAAAVFGAAKTIGQLKPDGVEVHFIAAAAENMISAEAYRPGDILTASNGKTVEIGNTDAEGRLTLADALVYAEKLKVDYIIDVATLTGACMVALGLKYAGVWSSDDAMAKMILDCGKATGEQVWHMPLVSEYRKDFDSKYADMNNIGGRFGGAIIAAVFLKEFVEKTPWAHIDIAGTAWDQKEGLATGFAVRTLVDFCLKSVQDLQ